MFEAQIFDHFLHPSFFLVAKRRDARTLKSDFCRSETQLRKVSAFFFNVSLVLISCSQTDGIAWFYSQSCARTFSRFEPCQSIRAAGFVEHDKKMAKKHCGFWCVLVIKRVSAGKLHVTENTVKPTLTTTSRAAAVFAGNTSRNDLR